MFDYRLFLRNNAQPVFFSIYKTLNITKSNFFQHCAKLHFIVNFHPAYFFCPFFILGICTIALVAYKECTAVFHNTVNLCKAFFKIFPKIYRLKRRNTIKSLIIKRHRRYIAINNITPALLDCDSISFFDSSTLTFE